MRTIGLLACLLFACSADASGVVAVRARVVVARPVVAVQAIHAAPVVVSPIYSAYSAPLALDAGCDCYGAGLQVRAFAVQRAFAPVAVQPAFAVQRVRVVTPAAVSIRAPFVRVRVGGF